MSNIKDAKPRVKTITLNDGVEREVRFTLNAMAELEERYGSVDAAFKALDDGSIKAARFVLWAGLMEAQPDLTEQQVGSLIDIQLMKELMNDITGALGEDMPEVPEGTDGVALPNA
jgi:hypothetical protein